VRVDDVASMTCEALPRGRLTVGELTTVVPLALEVAGALAGLSELHAEVTEAGGDRGGGRPEHAHDRC